jgi:leucyl aminopeptidase (aminopeptidase T)
MTRLDRALRKTLLECLCLQKDESLLIIIDNQHREIGQKFYDAALKVSINTLLVETAGCIENAEPPKALHDIIMHVNANLFITSHQVYHSQAIKNACHHGSRVICLSNISCESIERTINVDFQFIVEKSNRLADLLSIGKEAHVTSSAGTDLIVPINRYRAFSNNGIVTEPGTMASLPGGEASIPPVKRKSNGVIVVDGSLGALGVVQQPMELTVKDGYIKKINGCESAQLLRKIFKTCGPQARNLAKFGIGTNPGAMITGNSIEDEKVLGTVHFAFGDALYEGGRTQKPCHIDAIIKHPTVSVDGHAILENGELCV